MDFTLTDPQLELRRTIVELGKTLGGGMIQRDHEAMFSRELWRKCAALGICGLPFPEAYGGAGQDLLTTAISVEALAYSCRDAGLVHALLTQLVAGVALNTFGSDALKQRYLPALCSGEQIFAQAATEAGAGSDVFAMRTRAEPVDGGYVLNGTKLFISNGPVADVVIVLAASSAERKGFGGHSLFAVERGTPGFRAGKPFLKMGLRTLLNSELVFEDCHVPAQNLVGKPGQGQLAFHEVMEWERILFAAAHVGTMARVGEACVAHAKSRQQFGQPIGKFQAVATKIARMQMNTELARLLVHKAATLKDRGKRATFEAAAIKVFAAESLRDACLDAVQIHGASGYMTESEIERDLRDSIAGTIYSGTVEVNLDIIARLAGL